MNLFFVIVFLIYSLINSYLFFRGCQALPDSPVIRIVYCTVYLFIFLSFIVAMGGRHTFSLHTQKVFYLIGTTWLAVMLYLSIFLLFTDIIHWSDKIFHFFPDGLTNTLFHRIQVISGYIIVLILLIIGNIHFKHPSVIEQDIAIEKSGGSIQNLKAVAFSDMHLGIAIDKGRLREYVELINAQKPDIIFISGDLIDHNLIPLWEEKMYEELNDLQAPLGIYMAMGNHEYISGLNKSVEFINKTTITPLIDSAVLIKDSFWIIGRDDRMNKDRRSLSALTEKTGTEKPIIVLDHQPYHLEEVENAKIDFQFSGHTHAGQLWPLNYIVDKIYEVGHGYKKKGNTHIYVSPGLALWGPEFRIGTRSELQVFDIHFTK